MFYYQKRTERQGQGRVVTNLVLREFAGPGSFIYSQPEVHRATEAEKRNTGLVWSASAELRSTVARMTQLHSALGLKKWTEWENHGVLELHMERYNDGTTTADLIQNHIDAIDPIDEVYLKLSCDKLVSPNPFDDSAQTSSAPMPRVGQFVCPGTVLAVYPNRPDFDRLIDAPVKIYAVERRDDLQPGGIRIAVEGSKTTYYVKSGPPTKDNCSPKQGQ